MNDAYYHNVIETFFIALPFHYDKLDYKQNINLIINIKGMKHGKWILKRNGGVYSIKNSQYSTKIENIIEIEKADSWKIFTKAINFGKAAKLINFKGDKSICLHLLKMTCIMI